MAETRTPRSTYRVQVTAAFDLHATAALLPQLHDLGVDWVYLSPVLQAEPGSDHGYDVVDPTRVDESRGGAEGLAALSAAARDLGMGVLVDVVPNHVGVATPSANPWWWDLLTYGPESAYADFFDVDWEAGGGRLLVPVVGDDDEGAIRVVDTPAGGEVRYHDNRYPLAPGTSTPDEQHYRLVHWRRGDNELNYRRFFTVTTLAGVRVEVPHVFDAAHVEVGRWFREGLVDGLRVDHPDGLRDPAAYLDRLDDLTGSAYVLVEKILEGGERLPESWATAGTTGYDALALVERVLVDPAGVQQLGALDLALRGRDHLEQPWEDLVHERKLAVATGSLLAEVRRIVRELPDLVAAQPHMEEAVAEVLACFPTYRSYLPKGAADLDVALGTAHHRRPDLADAIGDLAGILRDPEQPAALRFQQTSGMVMAKGVEDSSFYRWSVLTSLDEVGGDPAHVSLTPAELHDELAWRQQHRPTAMTTLTTHDTKRGEDTRARITALAEAASLWQGALARLQQLAPVPDPGFANLLWQAVVGCWPARDARDDLRERLHAYAEKAMREAGDRTTWTDPDEAYEAAVHRAVDAAIDRDDVRDVVEGVVAHVVDAGWSNALAAKLLSLTLPGMPDVYQGSELWEQSLVDPDNRRPVDHALRGRLLASLEPPAVAPSGVDDPGTAKLWLVTTALRLLRDRPELFASYAALVADGTAADHLLGFDRGGAVTLVTRLPLGLAARGGWHDTTVSLPEGTWRDQRTRAVVSGRVTVSDVLGGFPVALLVKES
ncbi:malto-oligosyltrehalose synthase [Nocardioides marmoraquaticus]